MAQSSRFHKILLSGAVLERSTHESNNPSARNQKTPTKDLFQIALSVFLPDLRASGFRFTPKIAPLIFAPLRDLCATLVVSSMC